MAEQIQVEKRESRGKRQARKMREAGKTPAVLYGHGEANVSLSMPTDALAAVLRHGAHVVELQGAVKETALLKSVQWDPFGVEVLHVDLTRVSADESAEMTLALVLRGEAPGTHHGGIVEQPVHEIQLMCPINAIPEKLELNINHLEVGQSVKAKDVPIPSGAKLLTDAELIVVHCVVPAAEAEAVAPSESAEPELIGRKPAEAEAEEE